MACQVGFLGKCNIRVDTYRSLYIYIQKVYICIYKYICVGLFEYLYVLEKLHVSLYCHLLRNSFLFLLQYNHKEPITIIFYIRGLRRLLYIYICMCMYSVCCCFETFGRSRMARWRSRSQRSAGPQPTSFPLLPGGPIVARYGENVCVYIYVYVYTYMHTCIHSYIHRYIYTHIHI